MMRLSAGIVLQRRSELPRRGAGSFVLALLAAACGLAGAADGAVAQALLNAAQNAQQQSLANNILDICPRLAAAGGAPPTMGTLPADQQDLFDRCNGAIGLANLGQTDAAADVLGQIAAEEILAQQAVVDGIIEPQTRAIAARVSALSGRFGPAQVATLSPRGSDEPILLASAVPIQLAADGSTMSASFPSGLGLFLSGSYNFGEKDETSLEAGFDFDDYSITGGADYFILDNLVVGLAAGYATTDIDFDGDAGEVDGDGYNIALYSLWNPVDQFGISAYASYGMIDYESKRNLSYTDPNGTVSRTATGDTDADQFEVTGNAYYDFISGPWTYGPTLRLSYLRTEIDGFTEEGAQGLDLVFEDQDSDSLQTALGGAASHSISADFGVVVLQARAEWVHEFLDDSETMNLRYENDPFPDTPIITLTTDDPDRDRFLVGGGASFVFEGGVSSFADFETVLGYENVESYTITAGVRMEF